jgi:copper chaperone CopZ
MRQLNLFVDGMRCRRCVREVTALVRDVPGVETVAADATRSVIHLVGTMQAGDVLAAFAGSAFTPSLLSGSTDPDVPDDPAT